MAQRPIYNPNVFKDEGNENAVEKIDYNNRDVFRSTIYSNPTWRFLPKNNQRRILVKFLKKETINQLIEIHETKNLQYFKKDDLKEFFNYFNVFDKLSEFFINIDTGWRKIYLTDKLIPTINLSQDSKNLLEQRSGLNNIRLIYDIYKDVERGKTLIKGSKINLFTDDKDEFGFDNNKFGYKNNIYADGALGFEGTISGIPELKNTNIYLNKIFSLFTNKRVIKEKEDEEESTQDSIRKNTKYILLTCDELQDQKKADK